jgi:hypothetical protein
MTSTGKIEITGLREFQRSLRDVDAGLPKALRLALNDATGLVVDYAQAHIERDSGAARGSLKARSSQREARIAMGGSRAPYAPWLDFGGQGRVPGRPGPRPFLREGRYVYKGLAVHRADITERMSVAFTDLARQAGFEVS